MALTVETVAPGSGLTVRSPLDPQFDDLATAIMRRVAPIGLRLKPLLALLENQSNKTVVATAVTFWIQHRNGTTTTIRMQSKAPEVICGDEAILRNTSAIKPGHRSLRSTSVELNTWADTDVYFDQFLPQFVDE